ncbi:hypothetical protein IMG5_174360 [Ichthyophthirius multifiliis]|uniref:Ankyrin repeat protein n=1 Tax=Ichthyophthirius multifiliis TaxID=5932 RepID=G0R218_ICHMU|nr:hypothetical protein IMG5_174360 [Ichthyophthirius multifiliis]EGR28482.1 hypothetical protein IMG5_174360 [Ichthyophthirius multifiliis]|eukprot:XP_004029718.1 hypothetical protein IMG5_174360 [Ichthyophthirius multifiliis]
MGTQQIKEQIYQSIENGDTVKVLALLQKYPQYKNQEITDDCKNTPLTRSVWRNDFQTVKQLLQIGCDPNITGSRGISPLMWAAKRGHQEMAQILLENGANINQKSNDINCLKQINLLLQNVRLYSDNMKCVYFYYLKIQINYSRVPFEKCPNFYKRPPPPVLIDPVVDPREPITQIILRNLEFKDPPLVERNQLDLNLQPQNSVIGKFRQIINGYSPYPIQQKENLNNDEEIVIQFQKQDQQDELQQQKQEFIIHQFNTDSVNQDHVQFQ